MSFIGYENLTGEVLNGLQVLRIHRRIPELAYAVKCTRCGCEQIHTHVRLRDGYAFCLRGILCGREAPKASSSGAEIVPIQTATRSRDSAEAREFLKQERNQQEFSAIETYEGRFRRQLKEEEDRRRQEQTQQEYEQYLRYKRCAILNWSQEPQAVPSFERWRGFAELSKEKILEKVSKEENAG